MAQVCKTLGISEQTYYRWRREYGGLSPGPGETTEDLEQENARLKKLMAEQALDNAILKEASQGNFWPACAAAGDGACAGEAERVRTSRLPGAGSGPLDSAALCGP